MQIDLAVEKNLEDLHIVDDVMQLLHASLPIRFQVQQSLDQRSPFQR